VAEHPDVDRLRRALGARRGSSAAPDDAAALDDLLADDVVWHAASDGGDDNGKVEVTARWTGGGPGVEVDEVYADGEHAVALVDRDARGAGTIRQAIVAHLGTDGKVTGLWALPSEAAVVEAAASGRPVPEHPNLAPLLAAQHARARSEFGPEDMQAIERFFDPGVTWHMGGKSNMALETEGLDQVVARFKGFKQATGGTLQVHLREVFADDTHALGISRLTADRPGHPDKHMDVWEVSLFHLGPDGRAYEFWGIPEDEEKRDSFWRDDRDYETRLAEAKTALGLPALLTAKGTGGAISMLEVHLPPGALLAPVHAHARQDEASYVLEGKLSFYLGGDVHTFAAGQFAFKPKGVPHTIFNNFDEPARFLEFCWPGNLEEYLEEMAEVFAAGGPPNLKRIAEISAKYEIEPDFSTVAELGERYGVRQIGM
jgi:quercetin dioxygenase-like cupin family protein